MMLQGLGDHCGRFIDINAGWSGKIHDVRFFQNLGLFRLMEKGLFAPRSTMDINGVEVGLVFLGDLLIS